MKSLRRYHQFNADYFLTVVTHDRQPTLLIEPDLFWSSWKEICPAAWVILPDHFHVILNNQKNTISSIVHRFKTTYNWHFTRKYATERVWQNRFWDHIIRSEEDFQNHLDYIHYNPVKHGVISDPLEYEHSSLLKYYREGCYPRDWGVVDVPTVSGQYGE